MKIPNLSYYIKLYNEERILFEEIGPRARQRGYLIFDEFYDICMWKSRRAKPKYLKNKKIVESITKKTFAEKDEAKKIEILCQLEGVAIPTASAILTVVFPDKYAIIDIRCLTTLTDLGFKIKTWMSVNNWLEYTKIMRQIAKENNITPREVDMAFFAMHKEKLEKKGFKNLYK